MNKEDIENSKKGILVSYEGSKNLLVSFGGIQQGLGVPVFEFFNSIIDIPCDKIFIRDFNQAWYQKGVDNGLDHIDKIIEFLRTEITRNKYHKICFLGNSMGGYAAILFGNILNIDNVISFAPQTFIDKRHRLLHRDKRWNNQISEIYNFKHKRKEFFDLKKFFSKNTKYKTVFNIYYSPSEILDKRHAVRLKDKKNIFLHSIEHGGHGVVKTIRDNGELKILLKNCFENSSLERK